MFIKMLAAPWFRPQSHPALNTWFRAMGAPDRGACGAKPTGCRRPT